MAQMTLEKYQTKFTMAGPDECWPWQEKSRDKDGYGILSWRHEGKHNTVRAHRWGFEAQVRPLEPGEVVLHSCDNPPCQNRSHWSAGSPADNMADMKAKGRGTGPGRGENHFRTTLKQEQVEEIRRRYAAGGISQQKLGNEFGVSRECVSKIVRRVRW